MFINLSNHPSANWSEEQKNAAEQLAGPIVDIPFPAVTRTQQYIHLLNKPFIE